MLGFEVISAETAARTYFPSYLNALVDDLPITSVVDIGANVGQYGSLLRKQVGFSGAILSFEPVSKNFSSLERVCTDDPTWWAYQVAIGPKACEQAINVTNGGDLCSFLDPVGTSPALAVEAQETVRTETFEYVAELLAKRDLSLSNCFVKIDAQGFDFDIISGNSELLSKCAGLQIEAGTSALYKGERSMTEMLTLVNNLGFRLSRLFSGYEPSKFAPRYFDCVFVR
jgi:FkbM family methyltransferase